MLEQILLDRVNEYLIGDEIEGISVILHNNSKSIEQTWDRIQTPL
jgi:hypothetical protein